MYDRLKEVKAQHENSLKQDYFGVTLHPRDIDWLIEQIELMQKSLEKIAYDVKTENEDYQQKMYEFISIAKEGLGF